jgi:high affinity sulfate transporter 1
VTNTSAVSAAASTRWRLPIFGWLASYQRSWLPADIVGGLSAGAVVIPQAMAYATIAGLPVQVGLYTCLVPMLGYALLGGSRAMSFSTTSTIVVLTGTTLTGAGLQNSSDARGDLATLVLLVGLLLVAARLVHLGNLVENISDALLTGLKVGVGLTVAVGQIPKLLGIEAAPEGAKFFKQLAHDISHLGDTSLVTFALGAGSVAAMFLLRHFVPKFPAALCVVVVGIVLAWTVDLGSHGVALTAKVPSGLPLPVAPNFEHTGSLLPGAVAIALMAFLETVSVARNLRQPDEPPIDSDQELFANGAANVAGAFFQALPSAGGFSQSAVNQNSGAKTQVSALTTVVLAVLVALFLAPVLSHLPQASLAALVFVATIGLVNVGELVFLARFDRLELLVALGAGGVALVSGLLVSVAVGVLLTILVVLHELNQVPVSEVGRRPDGVLAESAPPVPGLQILRIGSPLYTANARTGVDHLLALVDAAERPLEVVVVDCQSIGGLSLTIVSRFQELEREMQRRSIQLWLAALPAHAFEMAHRAPHWAEMRDSGRLWPTVADAVNAYLQRHPQTLDT